MSDQYPLNDDQIAALTGWAPEESPDAFFWAKSLVNSAEFQSMLRDIVHRSQLAHTAGTLKGAVRAIRNTPEHLQTVDMILYVLETLGEQYSQESIAPEEPNA